MGGRARNSKPLDLSISKNDTTDQWEAKEDGITYHMSFSQMDDLKRKYKYLNSVEAWFHQLTTDEKKTIFRLGLPDTNTDYCDGSFIE